MYAKGFLVVTGYSTGISSLLFVIFTVFNDISFISIISILLQNGTESADQQISTNSEYK